MWIIAFVNCFLLMALPPPLVMSMLLLSMVHLQGSPLSLAHCERSLPPNKMAAPLGAWPFAGKGEEGALSFEFAHAAMGHATSGSDANRMKRMQDDFIGLAFVFLCLFLQGGGKWIDFIL